MNTTINTILIDDEQLAIDTLRWQISEFCPHIQVQASFTNPQKAYEYLQLHTVDLCFLDIDMPEMSGFDFLKLWDKPPFDIIFATAYNEYAIQAFKVSAFDYLLKPIDEEELIKTVKKYTSTHQKDTLTEQLQLLIQQQQQPKKYAQRIALPTKEGVHFIHINEIIRLEAYKNYTTFYLENRSSIIVSKTMGDMVQLLDPEHYIRVHQSHTINFEKVIKYERGQGGNLTMVNGDIVPVSKHKKDALLRKF